MTTTTPFDWRRVNPPTHPSLSTSGTVPLDQGERLPDPDPLPTPPPHDWRTVPMPVRVRELPTDKRGYPIFYLIRPMLRERTEYEGGEVDFRVMNLAHHRACLSERRCGICGRSCYRTLWFVGGPMCILNRVFGEGPFHEDCARYAMRVCPHLTHMAFGYHDRPGDADRGLVHHDPNALRAKPRRIVLCDTSDYLVYQGDVGKPVAIIKPPRSCEWYDTEGVYLCRTRPDQFAQ